MAEPQDAELLKQVEELQRDLRLLKARLAALERLVGNAGEHSSDKTTVREKAVYDWQG